MFYGQLKLIGPLNYHFNAPKNFVAAKSEVVIGLQLRVCITDLVTSEYISHRRFSVLFTNHKCIINLIIYVSTTFSIYTKDYMFRPISRSFSGLHSRLTHWCCVHIGIPKCTEHRLSLLCRSEDDGLMGRNM